MNPVVELLKYVSTPLTRSDQSHLKQLMLPGFADSYWATNWDQISHLGIKLGSLHTYLPILLKEEIK